MPAPASVFDEVLPFEDVGPAPASTGSFAAAPGIEAPATASIFDEVLPLEHPEPKRFGVSGPGALETVKGWIDPTNPDSFWRTAPKNVGTGIAKGFAAAKGEPVAYAYNFYKSLLSGDRSPLAAADMADEVRYWRNLQGKPSEGAVARVVDSPKPGQANFADINTKPSRGGDEDMGQVIGQAVPVLVDMIATAPATALAGPERVLDWIGKSRAASEAFVKIGQVSPRLAEGVLRYPQMLASFAAAEAAGGKMPSGETAANAALFTAGGQLAVKAAPQVARALGRGVQETERALHGAFAASAMGGQDLASTGDPVSAARQALVGGVMGVMGDPQGEWLRAGGVAAAPRRPGVGEAPRPVGPGGPAPEGGRTSRPVVPVNDLERAAVGSKDDALSPMRGALSAVQGGGRTSAPATAATAVRPTVFDEVLPLEGMSPPAAVPDQVKGGGQRAEVQGQGEEVAGQAGAPAPAAPTPAPANRGPELPVVERALVGRETSATGADPNRSYRFRYRLGELDDLVPSHDQDGNETPGYDQGLQPRGRERMGSKLQIAKIANEYNPEAAVNDVGLIDRGPVIADERGQVLSGNGRTLAQRAVRDASPEKWTAHREALAARAGDYGFRPEDVRALKDPVVWRELIDPAVDRREFAREANESGALSMSTAETAKADAARIDPETVAGLRVGDDQGIDDALLAAGNAETIRSFIQALPANERPAILTADGRLNRSGLARIKAALFAHVFPGEAGERLNNVFLESLEPGMKNVENGVFGALGQIAEVEARIRAGSARAELGIAEDVSKAVDMYARIRQQGKTVKDHQDQVPLFGTRELTPFQDRILGFIDANARRSGKSIREALRVYSKAVVAEGDAKQEGLFTSKPRTKEEIWNEAVSQAGKGSGQADLFAASGGRVGSPETADRGRGVPAPAPPVARLEEGLLRGAALGPEVAEAPAPVEGGGTGLARESGAEYGNSFVGKRFDQISRQIVPDDALPDLMDVRVDNETLKARSEETLLGFPGRMQAADGSTVILHNPQKRSIFKRALHLVWDDSHRRVDPTKAAWLPMVPETLRKAHVRLVDEKHATRIFVRFYRDGSRHAVVVRPDGTVIEQEPFVGRLITQFPDKLVSKRGKMIVDWSRGETGSERPPGDLRPTPTGSTLQEARQPEFRTKDISPDSESQIEEGGPARASEQLSLYPEIPRDRVETAPGTSGVKQVDPRKLPELPEEARRSGDDRPAFVMRGQRIEGGEDVAHLFRNHTEYDREGFWVVRTHKDGTVSVEVVAVGCLTGSLVHPRELFKGSLDDGVKEVWMVHNHPSGDTTPSPEDVQLTERLVEAGRIVGIDVRGHVIIDGKEFGQWTAQGGWQPRNPFSYAPVAGEWGVPELHPMRRKLFAQGAGERVSSSREVAIYAASKLRGQARPHAMILDVRNQVLGSMPLPERGDVGKAVFRFATSRNAAAVIFYGPMSLADAPGANVWSEGMAEKGRIMGIRVLDVVGVDESGYRSLMDRGGGGRVPIAREGEAREAGPSVPYEAGSDPSRALDDLRKSLPGIESPRPDPATLFARRAAATHEQARGAAASALQGMRDAGARLWRAWRYPKPDTDLRSVYGDYDLAIQQSNLATSRFAEEIKKVIPDQRRREAIYLYAESGGDEATLRGWLEQAENGRPDEKKPPLSAAMQEKYRLALDLTDSEKAFAEQARTYWNDKLQQAIDTGMLEQGVQDYVYRTFEGDAEQVANAIRSEIALGKLQPDPDFIRRRIFEHAIDAELAGLKVKADIGHAIAAYDAAMNKALASRAAVKQMLDAVASDGAPLVQVSGVGKPVESSGKDENPELLRRGKPSPRATPVFRVGETVTYRMDGEQYRVVATDEPGYVQVKPATKGPGDRGLPMRVPTDTLERDLATDTGPLPGEATGGAFIIKPKQRAFNVGTEEDPVIVNYLPIDHPALKKWKWLANDAEGRSIVIEGDLVVHPEAYDFMKSWLGTSAVRRSKVGHAALRLSQEFKSTLLSLSGFHQSAIFLHALEHKTNPMGAPEIDLSQPDQAALVRGGLMVAAHDGLQELSEGLHASGLVNKIPGLGDVSIKYGTYLFGDYIPRVKMAMALHALERNRARYGKKLSAAQIARLTAEQANAAFGEQNWTALGRSKTFVDVMRLLMLAPDFLVSRAKFVGQAMKPYGAEQSTALIRGALGLALAAQVLNYLLDDGKMHWDRPFNLVVKGREYALRTIQGDLLHLLKSPQSFVYNRVNPTLVRPVVEWALGTDQYGNKRSGADQLKDFFSSMAPIPTQGFIRPKLDRKWWESVLQAIGVNAFPYKTDAERKMQQLAYDNMPRGLATEEEKLALEAKREAGRQIADKDFAGAAATLREAGLSGEELRRLMKRSQSPREELRFRSLRPGQALEVWKLMDRDEKKRWEPVFRRKILNANSLSPAKKLGMLREAGLNQ